MHQKESLDNKLAKKINNNAPKKCSGNSAHGGARSPSSVRGKTARTAPYKSKAGGRAGGKKTSQRSPKGGKDKKSTGSPKKVSKGDITNALAKASGRLPEGQREGSTKKSAAAVTTSTKSPAAVENVGGQQRPVSRRGKDLMMKAGRLPPRVSGGGSGSCGHGDGDDGCDGVRKESEWNTDDARPALSSLSGKALGKRAAWKSTGKKGSALAQCLPA